MNKGLGLDHFFLTAQEPIYRHIDGGEALGRIRKVSIFYAIVLGYQRSGCVNRGRNWAST